MNIIYQPGLPSSVRHTYTFGGSAHFGKNFVRKSFGNLVQIASGADTLGHSFGHGLNVPVHGIINNRNLGHNDGREDSS